MTRSGDTTKSGSQPGTGRHGDSGLTPLSVQCLIHAACGTLDAPVPTSAVSPTARGTHWRAPAGRARQGRSMAPDLQPPNPAPSA